MGNSNFIGGILGEFPWEFSGNSRAKFQHGNSRARASPWNFRGILGEFQKSVQNFPFLRGILGQSWEFQGGIFSREF